jgi:RNA-binding protein
LAESARPWTDTLAHRRETTPVAAARTEERKMEQLTGRQRRHLRGLANSLQPVVYIGRHGLTDAVVETLDQNLAAHELVKVKFVDLKDRKRELSAELAERTASHLAGLIGHNALLYRPHADEARRKIRLPAPGGG